MLLSLLLPALLLFAGSADCVDERRCVEDVRQASCSRFFSGAVSIGHAGSSSSSGSGNSFPPTQAPWSSTFPNARNLTLVEALIEFRAYEKLLSVSNYCSYLLHSFLCIHYFPPCDPTAVSKSPLVVPCRQLCELATEECLDYVFDKYNISRPEHLNCSHFPERDTECTSAEKEVVLTACPTPGILIVHYIRTACYGREMRELSNSARDGSHVVTKRGLFDLIKRIRVFLWPSLQLT